MAEGGANIKLLGETVIKNTKGDKENVSSLTGEGKYVGLYFSAHWCPPCRAFTPDLVKFYEKAKENLEIVFISSDKDQTCFDEYYGTMPWLAVDFKERDKKKQLCSKFGVTGIPTFIILDGKSGNIRIKNARERVASNPEELLSELK